jgi:hypothetical protein
MKWYEHIFRMGQSLHSMATKTHFSYAAGTVSDNVK